MRAIEWLALRSLDECPKYLHPDPSPSHLRRHRSPPPLQVGISSQRHLREVPGDHRTFGACFVLISSQGPRSHSNHPQVWMKKISSDTLSLAHCPSILRIELSTTLLAFPEKSLTISQQENSGAHCARTHDGENCRKQSCQSLHYASFRRVKKSQCCSSKSFKACSSESRQRPVYFHDLVEHLQSSSR